MVELQSATRRFFRRTTLTTLALVLAAGAFDATPAFARHRHLAHRGRVSMAFHVGRGRPTHHVHSAGYTPPFAAYAVDGNSGRVLYGRDENALRHPASITKVMTLYLLFEQIEKGRLSLDSRLEVSQHAASMAPTKLGLRPGSTIRVEDAILAIVTKSANDMAVAVAERIGGDEESFARLMTRKAHALGMSRTNFVNASGLPDDMQLTTARDLATLGRAIHDHFPRYFHFFSTPSFRYAGRVMPNHNHLMEQIEGMDGIKTGYTTASGFNLLSSVNRNGHWLVSVVLGGKSRLGRDRIMADIITSQLDKCATTRTAPMVAENPALEHVAEAIPVIQHEGDTAPPVEGVDDESAERKPAASSEAAAADPSTDADDAPEPPAAPVARPAPLKVATVEEPSTKRARPAYVSVPMPPERDMTTTGSIHQARFDGSSAHYTGAATATPSALKHMLRRERIAEAKAKDAGKPVKVASLDPQIGSGRPAKGGWMIQIGATPELGKANDLIARAKGAGHGTLANAKPFTEKVTKGHDTLFRARFAGLDADGAEAACKSLKRSGMSCFATKN